MLSLRTMTSFKINYKIENELITALENISQSNGNLQVLKMNPDWASLIERKTNIAESIGSIGVEGTVVSEIQAKAITEGVGDVEIGEKEKREFLGYLNSLKYIRGQVEKSLSGQLLLNIHKKITEGDSKALPGKYRNDIRQVSIDGRVVFTPPPPNQLSFLLKEFFIWFNKESVSSGISPVVCAGICHFWFVWIHPFQDGNGRTARILTTLFLLKRAAEGIKYFALSDYYNEHKKDYYDTLEKTNKCNPKEPSMNFEGDMSPWLKFFIYSYRDQMKDVGEVTNRILQLNIRVKRLRQEGLLTDTSDKVLSFLSSREKASYTELTEYLEVSRPRVHQVLEPLRKAQILVEEKEGKKMWFKLGSPEGEPNESLIKEKVKRKSKSKPIVKSLSGGKQAILPIFN